MIRYLLLHNSYIKIIGKNFIFAFLCNGEFTRM